MKPTKPGYYWALWIKEAKGTKGAGDDVMSGEWEIVEVWENFIGDTCPADEDIKWCVNVHGVEQTQWVESFKWGNPVPGRLEIERLQARVNELQDHI